MHQVVIETSRCCYCARRITSTNITYARRQSPRIPSIMPIAHTTAAAAAACTFLLCSSSSSTTAVVFVDAFAQREDGGAVSGGGSRSRAAAVALASTRLNPLRGSLNTRTATSAKKRRRPARPSSSSDDFASRADDASSALATTTPEEQERRLLERRSFLSNMLSATASSASVAVAAAATTTAVAMATSSQPMANAYERTYPNELKSTIDTNEVENSSNSLTKLKEERISKKRALVDATRQELRDDPLGLDIFSNTNFITTIAGATAWSIALWFASGSSSNPLVAPVANVIYSSKDYTDDETGATRSQNSWLTDRNEGYDSKIPLTLLTLLSIVYLLFGILIDRAVYFFVTDGDADVSLQLGGVCAITAAVYEIGRLAAKEKPVTRMEYDRDVELYDEFRDFASKRIIIKSTSTSTTTCHRSDVISAFRRYNPKYRRADTSDTQYSLSDIEIERILKRWNREYGSGINMSSAGFFQGISIDNGADVFK